MGNIEFIYLCPTTWILAYKNKLYIFVTLVLVDKSVSRILLQ